MFNSTLNNWVPVWFNDINDTNEVNKYIEEFEPTSYPQFFITKNGECIETIFGTYKNVRKILEYYIWYN